MAWIILNFVFFIINVLFGLIHNRKENYKTSMFSMFASGVNFFGTIDSIYNYINTQ